MQQVSKSRRSQKRNYSKQRLLLLALMSLIALVTLGGLHQAQVIASEAKALAAASAGFGKGGSFPVENFQAYTSGFGYRYSPWGRWELHKGLDIAAPDGSYIRSWWTGQVVEVSDNTLCGTSIKIQSGAWQHIYCHMKGSVETSSYGRYMIDQSGGIQIWQGQQIPAGARIGRVGMTGRTTGPHLHWGLKYGNQYVDPALVLRAMYADQKAGSVSTHRQQRD